LTIRTGLFPTSALGAQGLEHNIFICRSHRRLWFKENKKAGDAMRIWTFANQKGGIGKTTTCVALGGMAADLGLRVLMLDLDPQGSLSSYFKLNPDQTQASSLSLFQERKNLSADFIGQLIIKTPFKNLCLLPASMGLATLERQSIGPEGMGLVIKKSLDLISEDFDLALIDCPPALGVLMVNALAACDLLVMPVQTEYLALKGTERMINALKMINRSRNSELPYLLVPTMYDRRTSASVTSLQTLRHTYGDRVWPGRIPIDTRLRDASRMGLPPHLVAQESQGIDGYRSLLGYLLPQKALKALREHVS
jgi:chromosome partitioning protein